MQYIFNKFTLASKLDAEIRASSITVALDNILTEAEQTTVNFKANLSTEEEDVLNALVVAHDPVNSEEPPQRVQPTVVYNEHLLVPRGLKKGRFKASDYSAEITLSDRNGDIFTYACAKVPLVGSLITQDDASKRAIVLAVDEQNSTVQLKAAFTLSLDDFDLQQACILSNPFNIDTVASFEDFQALFLWGLTFQARNYGEDDMLVFRVMMPTEQGLVQIKEYERTWVNNVHKMGIMLTPDGAPGEIPAGIVLRIEYYTLKTNEDIIHFNSDFIFTVKS